MKITFLFKGKGRVCLISLLLVLMHAQTYSQSCNCPPIATCGDCQDGLISLTLRYNGTAVAWIVATNGSGDILDAGLIAPNGIFTIEGDLPNGKFQGSALNLSVLFPASNVTINTNCGTPIFVNSTFGSFTVMAGESKTGGPICCAPEDLEIIPPVILNCPTDIQVSLGSTGCTIPVSWAPPTATDNCITVELTSNYDPGDAFTMGTTPVVYTATDGAGNTATCSFNVSVSDNTDPVIAGCPSNITVSANSACKGTANWIAPTATDNCTGFVALSSSHSPGLFSLGTTPVTYTATDVSGNISTCTFNVVVNDNSGPLITGCPSDITISANASCKANVSWNAPTATDNCGGAVTLSSSHSPGGLFSLGTTPVTYTATDVRGNSSLCTFNVIVTDNTGPVITGCPSDIMASANGSCKASVTWTAPTATDNCEGTLALVSSHSPGLFSLGTTVVTYTAKDVAGNISTCTFNIIVNDITPPVISGSPANITMVANALCNGNATWVPPTAMDNCEGAVTWTSSHDPGDIFPLGKTEVKYTATDMNGNVAVCQFNVVVKNENLPILSGCPDDIKVESNEFGTANINWIPPTATVHCGEVTLTSSHRPGDLFHVGTTKVEYKATDDTGNISTCSFNVTVSQAEIEINISKLVSPDGNGINDEWIVSNIEKFKDNKVIIVDRWGSVIFTASGYDNESVVWRGGNRNGVEAPTGTYFYTLSIQYGPAVLEKSGFIELIR